MSENNPIPEVPTHKHIKNIFDLKINPEYLRLVPRPSPEEFTALEADMVEKGKATEPILINYENEILDGHTRYEICMKHDLEFRTSVRDFDSKLEEKEFVIKVNLTRRHLIDMQKIMMAKNLEDIIAKKAKQRQGRRSDLTSASNEANVKPINTAREIALLIGVSKSTYERGKKIRDKGTPEEIEEALSKPRQISRIYDQIRNRENKSGLSCPACGTWKTRSDLSRALNMLKIRNPDLYEEVVEHIGVI